MLLVVVACWAGPLLVGPRLFLQVLPRFRPLFDPKVFVDGLVSDINCMEVEEDDDDEAEGKGTEAEKREGGAEGDGSEGGGDRKRKKPRLNSGIAKAMVEKVAAGLAQQRAAQEHQLQQQMQQKYQELAELQARVGAFSASLVLGGLAGPGSFGPRGSHPTAQYQSEFGGDASGEGGGVDAAGGGGLARGGAHGDVPGDGLRQVRGHRSHHRPQWGFCPRSGNGAASVGMDTGLQVLPPPPWGSAPAVDRV